MVCYLLEKGADTTIKDKTGRDALAIAQHMKRDGIVIILQIILREKVVSKELKTQLFLEGEGNQGSEGRKVSRENSYGSIDFKR
jgi:hypothetical protein